MTEGPDSRHEELGDLGNYAVRESVRFSRLNTLVVESQLYTAGALVSFDAYTIGKLPDHEGR